MSSWIYCRSLGILMITNEWLIKTQQQFSLTKHAITFFQGKNEIHILQDKIKKRWTHKHILTWFHAKIILLHLCPEESHIFTMKNHVMFLLLVMLMIYSSCLLVIDIILCLNFFKTNVLLLARNIIVSITHTQNEHTTISILPFGHDFRRISIFGNVHPKIKPSRSCWFNTIITKYALYI